MIKKVLTAVAFTVMVVLVSSCNKTEVMASNDTVDNGEANEGAVSESGWTLECDFAFAGGSSYKSSTKAVKTDWAKGDVVFIFINGIDGKYLKLTNTGGGWKTEDPQEIVNDLSSPAVVLNAIHVPFADDEVVPAYSGNTWTINTGDVYFSCATGVNASMNVDEETKTKKLRGTVELARQEDYVQVYFDRDERQGGIENLKVYSNQLDRYTAVTMDASGNFEYTGKDESGDVWFDAHELVTDGNSGIAIYGTLKEGRSATSVFLIKDDPIVYDFRTSKLTEAKAYKVSYNTAAKEAGKNWVRWTRSLPFEFQVNENGDKVRFTPGNLQASQVSSPHWKFADTQYSVLGNLNEHISEQFNNAEHYWDLFQWGATGFCNANCEIKYGDNPVNYPIVPLTPAAWFSDDLRGYRGDLIGERTGEYYYPVGSTEPAFVKRYCGDKSDHGIVKQCAFSYTTGRTIQDPVFGRTLPADGDDWGSNTIEFCRANVARTLTAGEWTYISDHYSHEMTTVCNVHGWAIAPKEYTISSSYDAASFAAAEKEGLVFFPRAGRRSHDVYKISDNDGDVEEGYRYWTSSLTNELVDAICTLPASVSHYPKASNPTLYPDAIVPRADFGAWGTAVRLVVDVFQE